MKQIEQITDKELLDCAVQLLMNDDGAGCPPPLASCLECPDMDCKECWMVFLRLMVQKKAAEVGDWFSFDGANDAES